MSASSSLSSSFGTLDVNGMVTKLIQADRNPQILLQNRQLQMKNKATAVKAVATDIKALRTAAEALGTASKWQPLTTKSSSTSVTTTGTSGAITGSLTFKVAQLASAEKLYSAGTIASTATKVAEPGHLLLAAGMASMGIGTVKGGDDLTLGSHRVAVTAAGAVTKGSATTLTDESETTIDVDQHLEIKLNGLTYTLDLESGTYTGPEELLGKVTSALSQARDGNDQPVDLSSQLKASTVDGKLTLTTTGTGSATSLQVLGTSTAGALTALGLSADATAVTGAATVTVDGVVNEIADADNHAGAELVLKGKDDLAGAMTFTLAGALKAGSTTVHHVDLGAGSLGEVVSAVNGAFGSVAASAVKLADNQYKFQLESKVTGAAGGLNVDFAAFTGGRAAFAELSAAADASVQVMAGAVPAYTISSASNTFTDALPGVTFTVGTVTADPVTVSATRDADKVATQVEDLVKAFNTVVYGIKNKSTYNAETKATGPLVGNPSARRAQTELAAAITEAVGPSALTLASGAGITLEKDGTLKFDKAKFSTAYQADPAATQRLFYGELGDPVPGIAQRVMKAADAATSFATGYLTTSGTQLDGTVASLGKQITAFEDRLKIREVALRRQWNAINVALEKLSSQNTSLAQALSGLSTGNES